MNKLRFELSAHIEIGDLCRSLHIEGNNLVGKFLDELFKDMNDTEIKELFSKSDYHTCEVLSKYFIGVEESK